MMGKETVLIVEDEKNIVELLKYNLSKEGFRVLSAAKGDLGLEMIRRELPDLVVLDLMLPEMNGLEICRIIRQDSRTSHIPVIILTAKSQETDKIIGLELGADDYMTKPFSPRELVTRVKVVLRRLKEPISKDKVHKAGILEIDTARHLVTLKGKELELTSKEYELLKALMEVQGRTLSRDFLLDRVWGYDESLNIETRTVDTHIVQLRKKIKTESWRIVTVKNVGYRFDHKV